jgi:DNA-binding NtrC family response regulator
MQKNSYALHMQHSHVLVLAGAESPTHALAASRLDLPVRSAETVTPLDAGSAGRVYLVPLDRLKEPDWPALRTRLAQANRFFIGCGTTPTTQEIVRACRDGAYDVLVAGDAPGRWQEATAAAVRAQSTWLSLYGGATSSDPALVGVTEAIQSLRRTIDRIGPTDASVLILGESGVGKEMVAQALHASGSKGALVAINCAALPPDLLEAELFGVTKGAFTNAHADRPGLVEQAAGGTLFLDEIGDLKFALQAKLLRFLETRTARRIGSHHEYAVSLRVVSATNRDLDLEVAAGRFRSDLFYRLAEISLRVPPLRQRLADIPILARHFLSLAGERFGKFYDTIEPDLLVRWQAFAWPGNIRELKSTIDRLVLLYDGPILRSNWWDPPIVSPAPIAATSVAALPDPSPGTARLPSRRDRLDRARQLLVDPSHDLSWIAAQVGVHPTTLFRWRKSGRL